MVYWDLVWLHMQVQAELVRQIFCIEHAEIVDQDFAKPNFKKIFTMSDDAYVGTSVVEVLCDTTAMRFIEIYKIDRLINISVIFFFFCSLFILKVIHLLLLLFNVIYLVQLTHERSAYCCHASILSIFLLLWYACVSCEELCCVEPVVALPSKIPVWSSQVFSTYTQPNDRIEIRYYMHVHKTQGSSREHNHYHLLSDIRLTEYFDQVQSL